ncbi:MAG TPA: hypothetical protein VIB82_05790 [Caulobacteraceae bacterium]|jgi:hypothetical protein
MDVIRALGAELWKMFAADLFLTLGALATVIGLGLLLHFGALPARQAPFVLAAIILGILVTAVNIAMIREILKRTR